MHQQGSQNNQDSKCKLVGLIDFNASIGMNSGVSGMWDEGLCHNNPDNIETNGKQDRLLRWPTEADVRLINTHFCSKQMHRDPWQHTTTGRWKRVDYIHMEPWLARMVKCCRAYTKATKLFNTDHKLLMAALKGLHWQHPRAVRLGFSFSIFKMEFSISITCYK